MRDLIHKNEERSRAVGKPGGRARMIVLALIAIVGISVVPGWLLVRHQLSGAEQEAKVALEEFGCHLITHPETGHVDYVCFRGGSDIDDATAGKLARLPHLVALRLCDCNITDEELRHLSDLPKLTWLNLGGTRISDDGAAYLADSLDLTGLSLRHTKISNEGLRHVARMRDLRILHVGNTLTTEEALKDLADMDNLRWLWITEITDAGVEHLMQMKNLECLSVSHNKISVEKLNQLQKAMPKLAIEGLEATRSTINVSGLDVRNGMSRSEDQGGLKSVEPDGPMAAGP